MSGFPPPEKRDLANPTGRKAMRRPPLEVPDSLAFPIDHFFVPCHYEDSIDYLMLTHGTIVDRVEKLAYDILKDYHGLTIHMCVVLKGASTFFEDLHNAIRRLHECNRYSYIPYVIEFVKVKSYEGTSSTGSVEITGCDLSRLRDKHVLFVEDIIDTGLTMTKLFTYMEEHVKPASVRVTSLLEKRTPQSCGFKGDYVGFSVPDKFVIGYCLDYNEAFRDLSHICVINKHGIEKYSDYHKI